MIACMIWNGIWWPRLECGYAKDWTCRYPVHSCGGARPRTMPIVTLHHRCLQLVVRISLCRRKTVCCAISWWRQSLMPVHECKIQPCEFWVTYAVVMHDIQSLSEGREQCQDSVISQVWRRSQKFARRPYAVIQVHMSTQVSARPQTPRSRVCHPFTIPMLRTDLGTIKHMCRERT